jgi:PPP family 3-phenylpropionic acid transporter
LADHLDARKQVLSLAAFCSGLIGFAYNLAFGFAPLLTVSMAHAAATASLAPLADALLVAASVEGRGFQYGWVRGAGSAAFVCGTLTSGQLIDRFGLRSIIVASSILFLLMTLSAIRIRPPLTANVPPPSNLELGVFATLWKLWLSSD